VINHHDFQRVEQSCSTLGAGSAECEFPGTFRFIMSGACRCCCESFQFDNRETSEQNGPIVHCAAPHRETRKKLLVFRNDFPPSRREPTTHDSSGPVSSGRPHSSRDPAFGSASTWIVGIAQKHTTRCFCSPSHLIQPKQLTFKTCELECNLHKSIQRS